MRNRVTVTEKGKASVALGSFDSLHTRYSHVRRSVDKVAHAAVPLTGILRRRKVNEKDYLNSWWSCIQDVLR